MVTKLRRVAVLGLGKVGSLVGTLLVRSGFSVMGCICFICGAKMGFTMKITMIVPTTSGVQEQRAFIKIP